MKEEWEKFENFEEEINMEDDELLQEDLEKTRDLSEVVIEKEENADEQ